jgi:hypothetical protein
MGDTDRAEPQVRVAEHHALGASGRARSIENGRPHIRIVAGGGQRFSPRFRPPDILLQSDLAICGAFTLFETIEPLLAGDKKDHTTVAKDVGRLSVTEGRVHGPRGSLRRAPLQGATGRLRASWADRTRPDPPLQGLRRATPRQAAPPPHRAWNSPERHHAR